MDRVVRGEGGGTYDPVQLMNTHIVLNFLILLSNRLAK